MKKLFIIIGCIVCVQVNAQAPDYPAAPAAPENIKAIQYFFDADQSAAVTTAIAPAQNISNFNFVLNTSSLSTGFHRLYIRSFNENSKQSLTNNIFFDNYLVPAYRFANGPAKNIVEIEYYIDTDPGLNNGTKLQALPPATDINTAVYSVNVTGLTPGTHFIYFRSKNENGIWSFTNLSFFDNTAIYPYPTATAAVKALAKLEYFIDDEKAFGEGTPVTLTGNNVNNLSIDIPVAGLNPGEHTLYIRSLSNPWSMTTIATFTVNAPLPVKWVYFKGELKNNESLLSWTVSQQKNVGRYAIEHSTDGVNYVAIGEVAAIDNSTTYSFTHSNPLKGVNYYRIKEVDKDGEYNYSKTIMLLQPGYVASIQIVPNPVAANLNILIPQDEFVRSIEIYTTEGKQLLQKAINGMPAQVTSLPATTLAKGSYYLKVSYRNHVQSIAFIKQ